MIVGENGQLANVQETLWLFEHLARPHNASASMHACARRMAP